MPSTRPEAEAPPPSLSALFFCFVSISLLGIGGGITAWIWQEVAIKRRWIDERKFVGGVALSQIVPGANAVNLAIYVGTTLRGAAGAVAAFAGLVFLPILVLLGLGSIYLVLSRHALFHSALAGMGAAAIGMNFATGLRLMRAQKSRWPQVALVAAIVFAIGYLRLPLLPSLAVIGPVSLVLALLTSSSGKS